MAEEARSAAEAHAEELREQERAYLAEQTALTEAHEAERDRLREKHAQELAAGQARAEEDEIRHREALDALREELDGQKAEVNRARGEAEKLAEENQLLRARLLGQKALEGGVTAEELDSMTDRDSFENLERELEAFVGLYERVWKQTKRKIRKDLLNLKYIKGQSGKQ
jgi:hypothetical protein